MTFDDVSDSSQSNEVSDEVSDSFCLQHAGSGSADYKAFESSSENRSDMEGKRVQKRLPK